MFAKLKFDKNVYKQSSLGHANASNLLVLSMLNTLLPVNDASFQGTLSKGQGSIKHLVKLLYFGMACHYSIAPWYPPYQPFSGIDRAMASWHGWRVMNLFSPKLQVKKSILAIDFIWIRALRLIFSQIYITRPSPSFFRPPSFSRILCFWEFRISENFGQANIWKVKTENRKSWNTKFSET